MKKGKWVAGVIIAFLLVLAGFTGKRFYDNYKLLKDDSIIFSVENKKLNRTLKILDGHREKNWDKIDSLEFQNFILEKDLVEVEEQLEILTDSLKKKPKEIEKLPVEASYAYIQLRYPDDSPKPFYLSEVQVKSVHIELASYDLLVGINEKLVDSNSILKNEIQTQEDIELGLRIIIADYAKENEYLLEELTDQQIKNIKVKVQRDGAIIVGAILTGVIAIISIL